jgi:exodeoxyribonuclease VII small subunit
MAKDRTDKEIEKLTFEQAIQQLKGIVDQIEQGEIPLQDSLEQYEKGMALIKHCRDILQKAEKRIEKISKEEPAEPEKEPEGSEPLLGG